MTGTYIGDTLYRADALFTQDADALPAAAGTTYSTGISLADFRTTNKGAHLADIEFEIYIGNQTVANLVDADTLKISIMVDTVVPIDASSIVLQLDIIDLLGAGGIGDLGQVIRFKIPSSEINVNIGGVTTQYDIIGCSMIHTGTGVPATASGGETAPDNDGFLHTRLVF